MPLVVLLPAFQTRRRARTPPRAAYQVQLRSQMWLDPNSQGITPAADFAKVVQAMREGAAYVNVHSSRSPGGEIRGPVVVQRDDHHEDDE